MNRVLRTIERICFLAIVFFSIILAYAMFIEPNFLFRTTTIVWHTGLNVDYNIVLISDVHLGMPHLGQRTKILMSLIREDHPNLIIVAGDLSDSMTTNDKAVAYLEALAKIAPVVFVYGNHDFNAGFANPRYVRPLEEHGVHVLMNQWYIVDDNGTKICIYGLNYEVPKRPKVPKGCSIVISVIHDPEHVFYVVNESDLVLAGHTHGGQVRLPFLPPLYLPMAKKYWKYYYGLYKIDGHYLYVTEGVGESLAPIRFLCPPEVVKIELVK